MNGEEIIHCLARDFAEYLNRLRGCNDPPDEYVDPIRSVFGETPTRETVIAIYTTKDGLAELVIELKSWCGSKRLTKDIVADMLRRSIVNNFGSHALQ